MNVLLPLLGLLLRRLSTAKAADAADWAAAKAAIRADVRDDYPELTRDYSVVDRFTGYPEVVLPGMSRVGPNASHYLATGRSQCFVSTDGRFWTPYSDWADAKK